MAERRPSKLGSLVGCFEQTISMNRENGCDKDLLGRSSYLPGSQKKQVCAMTGRVRRNKVTYSPLPKSPKEGAEKLKKDFSLLLKATSADSLLWTPSAAEPAKVKTNKAPSSSVTPLKKPVGTPFFEKPAANDEKKKKSSLMPVKSLRPKKPKKKVRFHIPAPEKDTKKVVSKKPETPAHMCMPSKPAVPEKAAGAQQAKASTPQPPIAAQSLPPAPVPPAPKALPPKKAKKAQTIEELFDEDDEIRALRLQLAALQGKLEQTTEAEQTELKAVEQDKAQRKTEYRQEQRVKYGLPTCEKQVAVQMINGMESNKSFSNTAETMQKLRQSNKILRERRDRMQDKMIAMKADNDRLKAENFAARKENRKMCAARDDDEKTFRGFTKSLPKYRLKIEKLQSKIELQESFIQAEKNAANKYDECVKQILTKTQRFCCETEEKVEVVSSRVKVAQRRASVSMANKMWNDGQQNVEGVSSGRRSRRLSAHV